jgi:ABC-type transporter Mla MlaB component
VQLVSTDRLHHRLEGAPTLTNARQARDLLDPVLTELGAAQHGTETAPLLEVSLNGVTDGNSVLVSLLLVWLRRARQAGVGIRFIDIPPLVMNLIEFTGLDEVLPMGPAGTPA